MNKVSVEQHKPDFSRFLKMLRHEPVERPVLFELFLNEPLYRELAGYAPADDSTLAHLRMVVDAFANAGYDYASTHGSELSFPTRAPARRKTISLNDGFVITDRASFEAYPWPDPDKCDYSRLEEIAPYLPEGMKLMVMGPGGVLENVISLVGYENLCFMLFDDPGLVGEIFDAVGSRLLRYYERAVVYDSVGMLMSNDDWGFNSQTFLSVEDMRKYVFPWHRRFVETAHRHGKPALLHSCGYMNDVMEDIIEYMRFDGKHSYEDNILPVEESYRRWGDRIAILGGMDIDFITRGTPEAVRARCEGMLKLAKGRGGYALGSGNSIPEYIPWENYFAMINTGRR
ncbi:MAG: uroporphyrinogen decarboxylase family protein [Candidatus Fimadaptatus sp.]